MKPISARQTNCKRLGFYQSFFDPDSKTDHAVIVSHSCATPDMANLLKTNPLQLYIRPKVFTFHYFKQKKVLQKIPRGNGR